jgi:Mpv17 / PMP22 family
MAVFGFFISAPINHYLVLNLQKAFRGKKGALWKLAQILAANLFVTPINCSVFVVSMAVIAGARTVKQIIASYKTAIMPVLRASWISSPLTLAVAQAFIPEHAWVPFFSLVAFFVGTYNNYAVKKRRQLAAARDKKSE